GLVSIVPGRAVVTPDQFDPAPPGYTPDTVSVRGAFNQQVQGGDKDFEYTTNLYGNVYPVLKFRQRFDGQQKLAVVYKAHVGSINAPLRSFGGQTVVDSGGVSRMVMKLIRAPLDSIHATANGTLDQDRTRAPLNVTRELELKNLYQLQGQRI